MTLTDQYIALIESLYDLEQRDLFEIRSSTQQIESALEEYYWEDIKAKIQYYFTRKNNKIPPNVSQILAFLETDEKIKKKTDDVSLYDYPQDEIPKTKLWSIKNTFDMFVKVLIDCGVIRDNQGNFNNSYGIYDESGNFILNPAQWLKWELQAAKQIKPEVFMNFPHATLAEQTALAIQNGLIKFEVKKFDKPYKWLTGEKDVKKYLHKIIKNT